MISVEIIQRKTRKNLNVETKMGRKTTILNMKMKLKPFVIGSLVTVTKG